MDDISREPLPGRRRSSGPGRRGPAEVVRLDDVTDAGGADPEPRGSEPVDGDVAADPSLVRDGPVGEGEVAADPTRQPAARPFALRPGPAVPMRIDPFGGPEPRDDVDPLEAPELAHGAADDPVTAAAGLAAAELNAAGLNAIDGTTAELGEGVEPDGSETAEELGITAEDDSSIAVPEVDILTADRAEADAEARAEPMLAAPPEVDPDAEEADLPELVEPGALSRVLLAVLLSAREPTRRMRLAEICKSTQKAVDAALERLQADLDRAGMPLTVVETGDAVRIMTAPTVFPYLRRLRRVRKAEKLSPAALETLAVVAYRQPAIRAEVEAIRGVKVGPMLRSLLDHKLVKVVGRADVPGRPLQYGTTQVFLERFGLRSLKDLPSIQEFKNLG